MARAKTLFMSACALTAISAAMPASAADQDQTGQNQADQSLGAAAPTQAAVSAPSADSGDIVVTARRRNERLLDVPISVTAISGDALAAKGILQVDDLQRSTPSLRSVPSAGRRSTTVYELRGISTTEVLITQDPAVGIYVNDVYRARSTGTNQSFFDIANVQVLYGPQGTLFGRNSTAGAVLINTNRPVDRFEGSVEAGYGNFNRYQITGMLNVPFSDTLQLRVAGQRVKSDGYATNVSTGGKLGGSNSYAGRASLLYKNADVENLLVGSIYHANDQGTPNILYGYRSSAAANEYGQVAALPAAGFNPLMLAALANARALGNYKTALDGANSSIPGIPSLVGLTGYLLNGPVLNQVNPFERPRNYSVSNTTSIQLSDNITLKNIFGYNYTKIAISTDLDATPLKLIDTYYKSSNKQISDEIQIQGNSGRLTWVAGALYFREKGRDFNSAVQFVSNYTSSLLLGTNTSAGVFAQGTYKITDELSFTGGARYTYDKREVDFRDALNGSLGGTLASNGGFGTDLSVGATCFILPSVANNGACSRTGSKSFKEPSWTATLDYKPNADTLLYVAHRHGYRSGGFNSRLSPTIDPSVQFAQAEPFLPEKVNDVEVGIKATIHVGQVIIRPSIAAYRAWYTDIQKQVTAFVPGRNDTLSAVTLITNAGKANVKGVEANLGITPVHGFDIQAFLGYVDGKYKDFPNPNPVATNPFVDTVPFGTTKTTAGATFSLTPIDDIDTGRVNVATSVSYRSHFYGDQTLPSRNEEARIPSQYNVDATLTWANILGTRATATGWVRNALNSNKFAGVVDLVPSFGIATAQIAEPRTYGFTLKYEFGAQ